MTWEDIKRIVNIADKLADGNRSRFPTEQSYYEEILNRYNDGQGLQ